MDKHLNEGIEIAGDAVGLTSIDCFNYNHSSLSSPYGWRINTGVTLFFVLNGGVTFEINDSLRQLGSRKLLVIAPRQRHRAEHGMMTPSKSFWIRFKSNDPTEFDDPHLPGELLKPLFEVCSALNGFDFVYPRVIDTLFEQMVRSAMELNDSDNKILLHTQIRSILSTIIFGVYQSLLETKKNSIEIEVQRAIDYIAQHFAEDMMFDELISDIGMSRPTFYSKFREITGFTPSIYLQRYRIHQAQTLMWRQERNITKVAFESGFNSSNYFAAVFKKQIGQTPREYLATIRKEKEFSSSDHQIASLKASSPVDLNEYFNLIGVYEPGATFHGGFDFNDYAYPASQFPDSFVWNDVQFLIGKAGQKNVVLNFGQTIEVESNTYTKLLVIAASWHFNQKLTVKLNYDNGRTTTYEQPVSNWCHSWLHLNEAQVSIAWFRVHGDGTVQDSACYLYGYSFKVDSVDRLESITIGDTGKIGIFAMCLT